MAFKKSLKIRRIWGTMLEIEIKFFLDDIESVCKKLLQLGAIGFGKVFETNIRYEDSECRLAQNNRLLRLRNDAVTTLTFKSTPEASDDRFKVHEELEVRIDNFETMNRILEAIGFHREQVYEKWRETFTFGSTHFCIDTMPYGDFLEIEGEPEDIENCVMRLGLNWNERILKNYLTIFQLIKENEHLSFSDITFENFKAVTFDIRKYLPLFRLRNKK
jgi:adenylate cyclase class 2